MSKSKHYTPPLTRFNVSALYHQAKELRIPMTVLANQIVEAGLKNTEGWKKAESAMGEGQGPAKAKAEE